MNYIFIGGLVQFLTVINLAYAGSLGYKESITNGRGIKKTSNGILMAFFLVCANGGQLLYKLMRGASGSSRERKKQDMVFTGVLSALITYGLALLSGTVYSALCVEPAEESSFITKLLFMAASTLQTVSYYGFVFGLFGGDNCRLVDTPISKLMSFISEKVSSMDTATFIGGKEDIVDVVKTEVKAQSSGDKGVRINAVSYVLSVLSKVVTTICESIGGITTILIDVANFIGALTLALLVFVMRAIVWFSNGMAVNEADVSSIVENPIDVFVNSVLSMIVSIVMICLIKLVVHIVLLLLPGSVSDCWYRLNDSLYVKSLEKLNNMSTDNLKYDKYAMRCSIRKLMGKASGDR